MAFLLTHYKHCIHNDHKEPSGKQPLAIRVLLLLCINQSVFYAKVHLLFFVISPIHNVGIDYMRTDMDLQGKRLDRPEFIHRFRFASDLIGNPIHLQRNQLL